MLLSTPVFGSAAVPSHWPVFMAYVYASSKSKFQLKLQKMPLQLCNICNIIVAWAWPITGTPTENTPEMYVEEFM